MINNSKNGFTQGKALLESVIICKHGKLGYSASLRFTDSAFDTDISSGNKESLYRTIEFLVRKALAVS